MKLKYKIFNNNDFFIILKKIQKNDKLNITTKIKLMLFFKKLIPFSEIFSDIRQQIIVKYGIEEKGSSVSIPKENINQYNKEMSELLYQEFEILHDKLNFPEEIDDLTINEMIYIQDLFNFN